MERNGKSVIVSFEKNIYVRSNGREYKFNSVSAAYRYFFRITNKIKNKNGNKRDKDKRDKDKRA